MLQKKERLTRAMFDRSFSVGKRIHHPLLQIIYDGSEPSFHGSAVVGKKVFKKAVDRNQMRRRLYGLLYRYHQANDLSGTWILIAKPSAKDADVKQLTEAIQTTLGKIS